VRDQAAALERALADHLRAAGHEVLGDHPRPGQCDQATYSEVCRLVDERLAAIDRSDAVRSLASAGR
jgi:hypothetical protein